MSGTPGPVKLAVLGAGLIGRRHAELVTTESGATLAAVVDPAPQAQEFAAAKGAPWFPSFAAMLAVERPDGVIIATPNQTHVAVGLEAIAAGVPALIEKPVADDVAAAERLVDAAERAGIPLLVGHHRRHNPLVRRAKEAIDAGRVGDVVAVHATCWLFKPAEYFDVPWRREKGAGPVLVNLIHDIDLLCYLCGPIVSVQAMESHAQRGNAVEETAVALLRFASGALGTVTLSDTIVAPWSWEFTSGENPAYTRTLETCYMIGGTRGSLSVPYLDLWQHTTCPDWWQPLVPERLPVNARDPLCQQIRNFCEVIRGTAPPAATGRDGLNALRVIAAIKQAAASGMPVSLT